MRRRKLGFTLLEMILVVAMMALVASIAVPMIINNLDNAKTESDDLIFEDIVKNTRFGILELNSSTRPINITSVINETLVSYMGYYKTSSDYKLGDCPLDLLPEAESKGKCVTIELIRVEDEGVYGGSGIIVRGYKDGATKEFMIRENGDKFYKMVIIPGVHFTVAKQNATIVDSSGNVPAAPSPSPAPAG